MPLEPEAHAEPKENAILGFIGEAPLEVTKGGDIFERPKINPPVQGVEPFFAVELVSDAAHHVGSQGRQYRQPEITFAGTVVNEGATEIGPIGATADTKTLIEIVGGRSTYAPLVAFLVHVGCEWRNVPFTGTKPA